MNAHVMIVGAGATGSHAAQLVVRLPEVGAITVVDHDRYTEENLESQAITREDIGLPKAMACAKRLGAIRPGIPVMAIQQRIQDIPLGVFRDVDVILACVDSRDSRRTVNQIAFRRGVPWIDTGVLADLVLARVSVFQPQRETACLECAWSDRDYALLEQTFTCGGSNMVPASRSPAFLASIAASFQVAELKRLLGGGAAGDQGARELLLDVSGGRLLTSTLPRNPGCRFDHEAWPIQDATRAALGITLAGLFAQTGADTLRLNAEPFATRFVCSSCRVETEALRIFTRLNGNAPTCRGCGATMQPVAFFNVDELRRETLPVSLLQTPLAEAGLREFDILRVDGDGGTPCVELKGGRCE